MLQLARYVFSRMLTETHFKKLQTSRMPKVLATEIYCLAIFSDRFSHDCSTHFHNKVSTVGLERSPMI